MSEGEHVRFSEIEAEKKEERIQAAIDFFAPAAEEEGVGMWDRLVLPKEMDKDISDEELEISMRKFDDLLEGLETSQAKRVISLASFYVRPEFPLASKGENSSMFVLTSLRKLGRRANKLSELIGKFSIKDDENIGRCLFASASSMNPTDRDKLIDNLGRKSELILNGFDANAVAYENFLKLYLRYGYRDQFLTKVQEVFLTRDLDFNGLINDRGRDWRVREIGEQGFGNFIKRKFGVDGRKYLNSWREVFTETKSDFAIDERVYDANLMAMNKLEEKHPEAVKYLTEQYGITHFSRYPQEALVKQFKDRDKVSNKPFLLAMYPEADYNGGFRDDEELADFYKQAEDLGRDVKIIEVGSKKEIIARLNYLKRKHGQIAGGIVAAHGHWDGMTFGGKNKDGGRVRLKDLFELEFDNSSLKIKHREMVTQGVRKFFVPNATLVFSSCSTGQEGGIAMELSKQGLNLIAPDYETSFTKIDLFEYDNIIAMTADYHEVRFIKPEAKRYRAGEMLE